MFVPPNHLLQITRVIISLACRNLVSEDENNLKKLTCIFHLIQVTETGFDGS